MSLNVSSANWPDDLNCIKSVFFLELELLYNSILFFFLSKSKYVVEITFKPKWASTFRIRAGKMLLKFTINYLTWNMRSKLEHSENPAKAI